MLTGEKKDKALNALNELSEIAKSLTGEEEQEKNPLRKGLDAVLSTMSNLVKGSDKAADGGKAGSEAGADAGAGDAGKAGGDAGAADGGADGKAGAGDAKATGGEADSKKTEKSLAEENDIIKSLEDQDPDFKEAYESSELVKSLCTAINNQNKVIDTLVKEIGIINKSITGISGTQEAFIKSFAEVKKAEGELMKSVHENVEKIGSQPQGRKSKQGTDYSLLEKSFIDNERLNNGADANGSTGEVSKGAQIDLLCKSLNEDGNPHGLRMEEITGFELNNKATDNIKKCLEVSKAL